MDYLVKVCLSRGAHGIRWLPTVQGSAAQEVVNNVRTQLLGDALSLKPFPMTDSHGTGAVYLPWMIDFLWQVTVGIRVSFCLPGFQV